MNPDEFEEMRLEYLSEAMRQKRFNYKLRKFLSQGMCGSFFCCCFKVKDLLNIPYDQMTRKQKKYRIKWLWKKARIVFIFQKVKFGNTEEKRKTNDMDEDGDDILENLNSATEHEWKWYIIRQENTLPQLWSFLTNTLTFYALFATPFVLVFQEASEVLKSFEMFVDVCFTLDICMNFFKLSNNQKESEFRQYRLDYLQSIFLFDCIAALPGLVTAEAPGVNVAKLARFIHYNRFFDQINILSEKILMSWLGYTRQKVSEYVDFVKLEMTVILLTHIMACVWIAIGRIDENSWVNVFLEDQRSEANPEPNSY